jgi:hypothetical protein
MNTPYFACPACRLYVESGYQWAYWHLEYPGVVRHNEGVDVGLVTACPEYWDPPEQERSEWLCDRVLPAVRRFLADHREHGIVYIDEETLYNEDSLHYNWSEVEI